MGLIKSFTDLQVWKEGHKLVLTVYKITHTFPVEEKFGLANQLRRAVVSFTSNIAEGFSRKSAKEKIQFYYMAIGSLAEVQNQIMIAKELNYITKIQFKEISGQITLVSKLASGLVKSAKNLKNHT